MSLNLTLLPVSGSKNFPIMEITPEKKIYIHIPI